MSREVFVSVRVSQAEMERLKAIARALGCKRSEAFRLVLASARVEGVPHLAMGAVKPKEEVKQDG